MSFPNIHKWTKMDPKNSPSAQAEQRDTQTLPQEVTVEICFSSKFNISQKAPRRSSDFCMRSARGVRDHLKECEISSTCVRSAQGVWDQLKVCEISSVLTETCQSKVHTGNHCWSMGTVGRTQGPFQEPRDTPSPSSLHDSSSSWPTEIKPSLFLAGALRKSFMPWRHQAMAQLSGTIKFHQILHQMRLWYSRKYTIMPCSHSILLYIFMLWCLEGKIRVREAFPTFVFFILPCSNMNMSSPLSFTVPK